ncbi:spermidine synthase [Rhodoferax sp. TH121]|uniref:polyamine aminopropyltransferase n=1 Tax=Rhodoferax sp. TH121 TaxID=2022803 RepID=UPI000B96A5EE|nr:polyamine aminopropyltransferase [Rhodoferax sp. TH121]OYQ38697.1 spermidine synthase [Rhodoferax sp. TH121]
MKPESSQPTGPRPVEVALLASVFVVAACGLVYELAAGALASYLLGDSVLQFSTVIGAYLFAMGIGSWLSRFFERQLTAHFLRIELLVALAGGTLPAILFVAHAWAPGSFRLVLYAMVLLVGMLVGLEIPLVMRILKRNVALKDLVSQVLTFDYLGALAVSVAFPLLLVPKLGLVRTGLLFGLLNAAVALWALWLFRHELRRFAAHAWACAGVLALLGAGMAAADHITTWAEDRLYQDKAIIAQSSPYQRIVVTHSPGEGQLGYRLFLNGNLQFAQRDEYRYHEALVHPAMAAFSATGASPKKVAVLGGGDGMAVREVLKYSGVESVTLVELDPAMTALFTRTPELAALNAEALRSSKVKVINTDAFTWLQGTDEVFDVIVVDFPDPTNFSVGKLFTNAFYALLDKHLAASGYAVVQTTSPLIARKSFWTVVTTMESVGLTATPYHAHVPSFGEWGFVLASRRPFRLPTALPAGLRFLSVPSLPLLFEFPQDMARVPTEVNRLSNQVLVTTYEEEWGRVAK